MPSNNQRNNELEFTPTFGTQHYGTDPTLKQRSDAVLSLSELTFTHQMARLILVEQIYRALMIHNNRSYHY